MTKVAIYHNPRCTKSRQTLALLRERGIEPEVIEYLKTPLGQADIAKLLKQLDGEPTELVRSKESREAGLPVTDDPAEIARQIAEHPQIMERPVVVSGGKARLGRPPKRVLEIL